MKRILRYKTALICVSIIALAGFLRLYHVEDWMHYELDQARDYRVIHTAIERGPAYLPLQGPKAAGNVTIAQSDTVGYGGKTTLRLGPLFYYIEYISALIFGDTPVGSIMVIVLLSIATVPLFYVFVREVFFKRVACGMTLLFAVSLFFVTYSRFGWNPNLIPFFTLATFYALLRATRYKRDHARTRGWWLIIASVSFAFLSNMHFLALIVIGAVAGVYLLFIRPKIPWQYFVGAVMVFIVLNVPLIINDVKTHGENTKAFIASLHSAQTDTHTLPEKLIKNTEEHIRYNWIIITGNQVVDLPILRDGHFTCDDRCKEGFFHGLVSGVMIFAGLASLLWLYKGTRVRRERHFILLIGLWSIITFIFYIPLAYEFAPRFFLVHAPVALIFLGSIIHVGYMRGTRWNVLLGRLIVILLVVSNLLYVGQYFSSLAHAHTDPQLTKRVTDRILGEKTYMTLQQLNHIAHYMIAVHRTNNFPLFVHGQSEFKRALWERIDRQGVPRAHIPQDFKPLYRQGNYFLVLRTQADQQKHLAKYHDYFTIAEKKVFGTLTLYHLIPRTQAITKERAEIDMQYHDPRFSESAQPRYLWHQVFSACTYDYVTDTCITP